jgi:hypothetical protein
MPERGYASPREGLVTRTKKARAGVTIKQKKKYRSWGMSVCPQEGRVTN